MKRKNLLFALLVALFMPWAANAQETVTVCDGTTTNSKIPVNSLYTDTQGTTSEFIIPAETEGMSNMEGGTISKVTFYISQIPSSSWGTPTIQLYIGEVDETTLSSLYGPSNFTVVKTMVWSNQQSTIEVEFDEPYTYEGGNLLIGTYVQTKSSYTTTNFLGVTGETGCSRYNNGSGTGTSQNFLPKTTFVYEPAQQGGDVCEKPATLVAGNVTGNSATLTWTGGSGVYNIELNGTIIEENFAGYSYNLTDLAATTAYTAKVQSVCDGSTPTSGWKSVSFTTPCASYDIPYTYGFEDAAPFDCWTVISGTVSRQSGTTNSGSYRLDFRGTTSNMIALPQFNEATNNLRVEFWTRPESTSGSSGKFAIGYMTDITDASTFVAVDTYNSTQMTTTYVKKTVDMVNVPANANIAMRQFDCSTNFYWYVDDVTVKEMPSCLAPTGLATTASATSAELSWTANSGETAWTLYWKESSATDYTEVANVTNPYTLNGLIAASNYEFYVVANCSADDTSEASEVFTFATLCETVTTFPWTENFNSLTAGIPNCWDNSEGTTTYESYKWNYYATGHDGAGLSFNSYNNSSNLTNFLKTVSLSLPSDQLMQLSFWYKNPAGGDFSVYISTDGGATHETALATGLTGVSTWTELVISLADYAGQEVVIVFKGTSNYGNGDAYIYLDDVAIAEAPSCLKPTGLAVTEGSITNSGATITWTAGGDETNWQIEFATDADFTNPLYETVEGEPNYTFHGLDDLTTYYVHVQAVCGGSDGSSEYCAPVSFTTLQAAANLPYSNDFESENGWVFVNGTRTNAWVYGEATNNGGTHALYISNDGGTSNAYTIGSAAMVYATKLFNFEAGTYVFSYDWKANGESNYDYLRVALVPSSVILTAGTIAPSVPSGSFYNNLPTGWIALDGGGKLNLKSDWQSFVSTEIEIATAGSYMMVFAWTDDTSGGTNPPAAIDNVSIEVVTCHTPTGLAVNESATTATSVELSWTENGEATAWQIELTDEEDNVEIIDANSNPFTLTELTPESMYAARVRAYCDEDNQSRWSEEVIFETAEVCQMSDGLAAVATTNSAAISWNGYGQEEFNLRYSTDGETWTTESRVANPYTLASLTPATTYQVQVQPTCADAETWSATYTFHTLCESIVVTDTWSEGFEDGVLSFCWDQDGNGTWTVGTGYNTSTGAHTGTYNAKIPHGVTGHVTKLITPVLDLTSLNNPMLTFWYVNLAWGNDIDGFAVYYRTASDAAWTQIYATEEAHATWTMASYVLPNPSATYQIAFEMTDGYGYGVGIDDVTIEDAPTYTLTIQGYDDEQNPGGWYLIASPIGDVAPSAVTGMLSDNYDLFIFDQAAADGKEWRNCKPIANTFKLEAGKGYLYASKEDTQLVFTGKPYSGDGTVTLTMTDDETVDFQGWNLVGNPFSEIAYLPAGRAYYTMQNDGQDLLAATGNSVEAMEGVFVIAANNGEELQFTTSPTGGNSSRLGLNLSNGRNVIDRVIVRFGEGQQLPKFQLNPNHTKVYMPVDGKDYAIVNATEMGEMPVNFKAENNGTYTLSFSSQNAEFAYLHLIDNLTGTDVDMLQSPSYSFEAKTTDYESRFKLVFATGDNSNDDNFAFFSNGSFVINNEGKATLQVVDVTGRILKSESINGCANVNVNAAPGVYMLRLVNGDNVKTQKVVVK